MSTQKLVPEELKSFENFETNVKKYGARRAEYKKKYPKSYVAVLDGEVVAHSKDLNDLIAKLEKKNEDLSIFIIDHLSDKLKLLLSLQPN